MLTLISRKPLIWILIKPTLIVISHLGLQHIQKQENSKRVGYKILKFCLHYNRMTHSKMQLLALYAGSKPETLFRRGAKHFQDVP